MDSNQTVCVLVCYAVAHVVYCGKGVHAAFSMKLFTKIYGYALLVCVLYLKRDIANAFKYVLWRHLSIWSNTYINWQVTSPPQYLSNLLHLSHNNNNLRSSDFISLSIPKPALSLAKGPLVLLQQVVATPFNAALNFQLFYHSTCLNRNRKSL